MPKYKIADLTLNINEITDKKLSDSMLPYKIGDDEQGEPLINVTIKYSSDHMPIPQKNIIARRKISIYTMQNGEMSVSICDTNINTVFAYIHFSRDYDSVYVQLLDVDEIYNRFNVSTECFAFNVFDIVFQILIQHYNGFIFHASSIVHNNMGIAFSANSGTGKSTHTAIWQRVYPNTVMINDDAPAIRIVNKIPYIYGTPWAGTTGINSNIKVPLRAIVFLERGGINSICELSTLNCIKRFFAQVRKPVTSEHMSNVLNALDCIIAKAGTYILECNMEDNAAVTVENYLFEKGKKTYV